MHFWGCEPTGQQHMTQSIAASVTWFSNGVCQRVQLWILHALAVAAMCGCVSMETTAFLQPAFTSSCNCVCQLLQLWAAAICFNIAHEASAAAVLCIISVHTQHICSKGVVCGPHANCSVPCSMWHSIDADFIAKNDCRHAALHSVLSCILF